MSVLQTILEADLERSALLREEAKLNALIKELEEKEKAGAESSGDHKDGSTKEESAEMKTANGGFNIFFLT